MFSKDRFFYRSFVYINSDYIFRVGMNLGLAVGDYLIGHILLIWAADICTLSYFLRRVNMLQELCSMKYGYKQQFKSEGGYMKAKT